MRALKNPHELPFERLEDRFDLASMNFGRFQPAVWKKDGGGYGIRLLTGSSWDGYSGTTRTRWEYFHTDETGIVTESPRGLGKEYNGRYRITGLEKAVEKYKDKPINHR